jgi:CubicO group peptidase (beta-lactamase class C family)
VEKLHQRSAGRSGVFAVVTSEGGILRAMNTGEGQAAPLSDETPLPLGSITKMFVAATAVSLEQEGMLDLTGPIAHYLPELGADSELGKVTLHQLLTHTSGIMDPADLPLCVGDGALEGVLASAHLAAPAGAVYLYSNLGYSLAGLVIERAAHKPFEEVVRDRVLAPMAIGSATFDESALRVPGRPEPGVVPRRCRAMHPSGGLIMSARDLARWAHAMSAPDEHPLGRPLVERLTAPYVATGERPGETYGYGIVRFEQSGLVVFCHGGNLEDFSAFVAWSPARRFGSVAFVNTPGAAPMVAVLRGMSVFLDLSTDWRPRGDTSHALASYVGVYLDPRGGLGRVRVRLEGKRLAYDYPDGAPHLLPPWFRFQFRPGNARARYVVTLVGVGERVGE